MHIIIAGAGRVGGRLAHDLAAEGHDVVVVDSSESALADLGKSFNGATLAGEAYDVDVLREARTSDADSFCAMTDDDNVNLMAAEVARAVFGVDRVLARLQDPAREDSYRALGIPFISTTRLIAAVAMKRVLSEDLDHHLGITGGELEITRFVMTSSAEGMNVGQIEAQGALRVTALHRDDAATALPGADTPVTAGDVLVVAGDRETRRRLGDLVESER